ncbi:hypothetical protein PR202_gb18116 [Eleusine coracana subsp. coracana]|uniref:Uncharacterized protein n=1 Tax=Eleusine coracana subsp. coracana TaxID=191504 RepID=A0AAV5F4K0_ELECO|nr:hypothetical protein PR202_gb18048 [Eleusine coracana subsp. coracana]GJN29856.1 hypothetical protein PR202_gb18116 [Eleusine coracana subsp. coracana]
MERKVVIVCAVVGFLGVLSAALGFAAEATRVKVRHRFASSPRPPPWFRMCKHLIQVVNASTQGVQP